MRPPLETAALPADAVEVGRILDAWGIKGWFKVLPHSASPEALFSCPDWFLLPPERKAGLRRPTEAATDAGDWTQPLRLRVREVKDHSDSVVGCSDDIADRNAAESLKGARVFVPRSGFPTPDEGEFYWVYLIGLHVRNPQGEALGRVVDLLDTGPQSVLRCEHPGADGKPVERLIPFVSAFVDQVDTAARRITVDWQPDY